MKPKISKKEPASCPEAPRRQNAPAGRAARRRLRRVFPRRRARGVPRSSALVDRRRRRGSRRAGFGGRRISPAPADFVAQARGDPRARRAEGQGLAGTPRGGALGADERPARLQAALGSRARRHARTDRHHAVRRGLSGRAGVGGEDDPRRRRRLDQARAVAVRRGARGRALFLLEFGLVLAKISARAGASSFRISSTCASATS